MRKLILHIGSEKTGTTSIQKFLSLNRSLLAEQGILYPQVGFSRTAHFSLVAPFHHLDNGGKPLEFAPQRTYRPREEWAPIKRIFDLQEDVTVLLSAEHFSSRLKAKGIPALKEVIDWVCPGIDIRIIYYIRRQDDYFQSWYSTHIKAGGTLTVDEAYKARLYDKWFFDYYHIAKQWEDCFGTGCIDIAVYEDAKLNGGLIKDFCNRIGLASAPKEQEFQGVSNISWPAEFLQIARLINIKSKESLKANRLSILEILLQHFPEGSTSLLSKSQRQVIMDTYKESNDMVAEHFLGKPGIGPFPESGNDNSSWSQRQELTASSLVPVLVSLSESLLRKGQR